MVGRHRKRAHRPDGLTNDVAKDRWTGRLDLDLDEARKAGVPPVNRRDVDVDDLVGIRVVKAVPQRDLSGCGFGCDLVGQHEPGAGQGGGIRGILLVASLQEHHAHVERERGDDQEGDEAPGEQDQNLTLILTPSSAPSC
jgi:hypothetical protein